MEPMSDLTKSLLEAKDALTNRSRDLTLLCADLKREEEVLKAQVKECDAYVHVERPVKMKKKTTSIKKVIHNKTHNLEQKMKIYESQIECKDLELELERLSRRELQIELEKVNFRNDKEKFESERVKLDEGVSECDILNSRLESLKFEVQSTKYKKEDLEKEHNGILKYNALLGEELEKIKEKIDKKEEEIHFMTLDLNRLKDQEIKLPDILKEPISELANESVLFVFNKCQLSSYEKFTNGTIFLTTHRICFLDGKQDKSAVLFSINLKELRLLRKVSGEKKSLDIIEMNNNMAFVHFLIRRSRKTFVVLTLRQARNIGNFNVKRYRDSKEDLTATFVL